MDNQTERKQADSIELKTVQKMMPDRAAPERPAPTRQHIDPSRFCGCLTAKELEHLAACPWCRDSFADFIEGEELLKAPADFKSSVLERSRGLDVQIIAGSNHLSKKLQMFYFSLKVGTAVLCALALLTVAPDLATRSAARAVRPVSAIQETAGQWEYYERIDHFTKQLNRLTNLNMEVFQNDKEKR